MRFGSYRDGLSLPPHPPSTSLISLVPQHHPLPIGRSWGLPSRLVFNYFHSLAHIHALLWSSAKHGVEAATSQHYGLAVGREEGFSLSGASSISRWRAASFAMRRARAAASLFMEFDKPASFLFEFLFGHGWSRLSGMYWRGTRIGIGLLPSKRLVTSLGLPVSLESFSCSVNCS